MMMMMMNEDNKDLVPGRRGYKALKLLLLLWTMSLSVNKPLPLKLPRSHGILARRVLAQAHITRRHLGGAASCQIHRCRHVMSGEVQRFDRSGGAVDRCGGG